MYRWSEKKWLRRRGNKGKAEMQFTLWFTTNRLRRLVTDTFVTRCSWCVSVIVVLASCFRRNRDWIRSRVHQIFLFIFPPMNRKLRELFPLLYCLCNKKITPPLNKRFKIVLILLPRKNNRGSSPFTIRFLSSTLISLFAQKFSRKNSRKRTLCTTPLLYLTHYLYGS